MYIQVEGIQSVNVNMSNNSIGKSDPVVEIRIKVFVNNGEVQVTSDVNKTKPANPRHHANPRADSPPLIDLTIDEDQRDGLVSNGRTTSTDPFEETPTVVDLTLQEEEDVGSEEDDPKEDDVQEEDIVPDEDILVRDVTEEEWEESGFDRD
ncbi:uncharacterized protein LOC144911579 [Branchiostoma floridae x Branchiostoma belcheri]